MRSDPALALSLTLLVALFYLVLLRLIDPYEKEPLWALGLMLFLGASSAGAAAVLLAPDTREESALAVALTAEVSKMVAIALGFALFGLVRRLKGWSEVNGITDGVVYGAAAGLGFATGGAFVSEIAFSAAGGQLPGQPGFLEVLWTTALSGLSEGVFGGMIGAGIVAAWEAHSRARRLLLGVGGLLAAVMTHLAYAALADPGSPFDSEHLVGDWLALGLSILLLLAVLLRSVAAERRAATELDQTGRFRRVRAPSGSYLRTFAEGAIEDWLRLRALNSRRVQLAIVQRRLRDTPESAAGRRHALEEEIRNLRESLAMIESEGPAADGQRWLPSGRPRVKAWLSAAALLACGSALIVAGAVNERDAEAREAERLTKLAPSSGPDQVGDRVSGGSSGGGLRDQLAQRVGPYLLTAAEDDGRAFSGAWEAYHLSYRNRHGAPAHHHIARFPSKEGAERSGKRMIKRLQEAGWSIRVRDRLWRVVVLTHRGRETAISWNGRLQASATVRNTSAWEFLEDLPY